MGQIQVSKIMSKKCCSDYVRDIEARLRDDPRSFWWYVSGLRVSSSFPSQMSLDGDRADSNGGMVDLFAKFFSSVYVRDDSDTDRPDEIVCDFRKTFLFHKLSLCIYL